MSWLFEPEVIALGISSISLILVLSLAFTAGVKYQISYDKLPAATRLSELEVLVGGKEARLFEIRDQLRQAEAALAERDQAEAEANYWRAEAETARAEYEALSDQRAEIEETRESYRQAVEELTLAETQLRELQADAEIVRHRSQEAADTVAEAERRLSEIAQEEQTLRASQDELHQQVSALEEQCTELNNQRSSMAAEVEQERYRLTALKTEARQAEDQLNRLNQAKESAEAELDHVLTQIEALSEKRAAIEKIEAQLSEMSSTRDALEAAIDVKEREERRLLARIAKLEDEYGGMQGGQGTPTDDRALEDLTMRPACLAIEQEPGVFDPVLPEALEVEQEADALQRVIRHLEESGFEFSRRTINAFHTSLKTAVISPLTVLAGISGTGKSQLPKYYADAMGIHFLKIPVQPRWDSPQDLFGFYNYIEKRYKATDLARSLVHLDAHNWPDEAEQFEDRMLLVLLDEMNLARVEYYFSEFLSRLEGRPFDETTLDETLRLSAEIDIDVTREGQSKRVYAGQNILFVGTMNEDESTLALSDKVLDRANIMRFPRPPELKDALPESDGKYVADGYLPKSRWLGTWTRTADRLDNAQHNRSTELITKINDVMNELGRPYGHRTSQAMLHYVANYPVELVSTNTADRVNFALADQIELRILPKLRGIVIDDYNRHFRDLADIAEQQLSDPELAEEINECVARSHQTNGMFVWRGLTRP